MRRRRWLWATAALALVLIGSPGIFAELGEKKDFEIGVYFGRLFPDDFDGLEPGEDRIFGGRIGYFCTPALSIEGSYQTADLDVASGRLNALWNFLPGKRFRPFATVGVGLEDLDFSGVDDQEIGYNAGLGARYFFASNFGIRLDGRFVATDWDSFSRQNNVEATLGLLWTGGGGPPPDTDGDGVKDSADKCPDTPRGATVDATGCPKDEDGDGVYDGLDKCPGTPKGATVDATGCPKDEDGDGVYDGLDKCLGTPRGATVDATGCPKDEDGDGVYDGLDKCPGTPRGTMVDASGCPVPAPTPAPTPPPPTPIEKKLVLEGVEFELDSAKLTPASLGVLDRVAASLKDWPDVPVEVAGHTDSSGSTAYNERLSQRRADAVRDYLISQLANGSRITAQGYGESAPIADNATPEGRARNRRVELNRRD